MNSFDSTTSSSVQLAIIDIECTCDDGVPLTPSEIIEIGAVIGNLTLQAFTVKSELQIYVKPVIHETLTTFCTQLTGITQHTVDNAIELPNALSALQGWLQQHETMAWASWGKFDMKQFALECEFKALSNPMKLIQHFNVKQLFARKFGHRVGLERALNLRGMIFDGTPHSGLSDAKNIAHLVEKEIVLRDALMSRLTVTT